MERHRHVLTELTRHRREHLIGVATHQSNRPHNNDQNALRHIQRCPDLAGCSRAPEGPCSFRRKISPAQTHNTVAKLFLLGDTRFVEVGRYLCEVRVGQYWRLEKLKSFDEFLASKAVPGVQAEGLLPHVDPCAPATAGQKGFKSGGMDQGTGVGESRQEGWTEVWIPATCGIAYGYSRRCSQDGKTPKMVRVFPEIALSAVRGLDSCAHPPSSCGWFPGLPERRALHSHFEFAETLLQEFHSFFAGGMSR
jgi:hypothetical protein